MRRGTQDAIALGVFQAHALVGPVGMAVLFATDHLFLMAELGVGATCGWYGWWRFFGLRWHVR